MINVLLGIDAVSDGDEGVVEIYCSNYLKMHKIKVAKLKQTANNR